MKIRLILFIMPIIIPCFAQEPQITSWETICKQVKSIPEAEADQPKMNEAAMLSNCDSEAFYYGIGQKADYKQARYCAYLERQKGDEKVFGGSAILMMIYANGLSVEKNIPIAERFACSLSGAPAEMEGRIKHLEDLKTVTLKKTLFDLCDDITSGFMGGYCTKHRDRFAQLERDKNLEAILEHWTVMEKTAFNKLQKASNNFTDARVQNEVDQSGTLRGAFMIEEEAIQKKDFIESLQKLESSKAPKYSSAQFQEEDRKLNSLYQMIQKKDFKDWGTVTHEGIKRSQLAWLKYRDAWIEFAKLKYPTYSSDSISAWFTKKRNHMFRSILR